MVSPVRNCFFFVDCVFTVFRGTFRVPIPRIDDGTEKVPKAPANEQLTKGQTLKIPELLEDENPADGKAAFTLNVQAVKTSFIEGTETDTLGYNGAYLGPVIRVRRGDEVQIQVNN